MHLWVLIFNFDADAGLEFHSEVVSKNGDLLDELLDECFVKFCDIGFLLADKVLQLFDPVHGFFPAVAVQLGFLFLFPDPEDLVGDGVVVLFAVGLFDISC